MKHRKMKKAFTLLEMIFVVVISGVLSIGAFKAFEALYIRSAKAKAVSELSIQSQIVLNQLSALLYSRVPNSAVGYRVLDSSCASIEDAVGNYEVLEWLSLDEDQLLEGRYSGFVDMNASSKASATLATPGVTTALNVANRNLIFAGAFDGGSEAASSCGGAYGWHGTASLLSHDIASVATNSIVLANTDLPQYIYEKYYLANGAYAVTRGEHVGNISGCGLNESDFKDFDNTLFLFYDFYPYSGQTYCADNSGVASGKVAVLAEDVAGFRASYENDIIRLSIDMNRTIRGSSSVHISKQKAVF